MAASDYDDGGFNFILAGKTGAGKSATGNSILGQEGAFVSKLSAHSVTKTCSPKYVTRQGVKIMIVDAPGLGDTDMSNEDALKMVSDEVTRAVATFPDGYDAILIVIGLGRLTEEDRKIVTQLNAIFGKDYIKNYGILIVTHGANFDSEENDNLSFHEWAKKEGGMLGELMTQCRNRVVLFENKTKDKSVQEKQLKELFDIAQKMRRGPKRFQPSHFQEAQTARDRLFVEMKEPLIREKTERDITLIMQELKKMGHADTNIVGLADLKVRAQKLLDNVKEQDKGTGALEKVIKRLEEIAKTVDDRISEFQNALKVEKEVQARSGSTSQAVASEDVLMHRMMNLHLNALQQEMEAQREKRIERIVEIHRREPSICIIQ